MPHEIQNDAPSVESTPHAGRLARLGYGALAVGTVAYWSFARWEDPLLKLLASAICIMGIWPILRWLQRNDQAYPLLEVLQLTMVPFYAFPLITEHEAVMAYPESILIRASLLVLIFQIACSFGGMLGNRRPHETPGTAWWRDELIPEANLRFTSYTMILTTVWFFISALTHWVPAELVGTLRAV